MKLSSFIHEEQIILNDDKIHSAEDLFMKASNIISEQFTLSRDEVYNSFMKRYDLGYDIFEDRFALPHCRLDNFNDLIFLIIKTKNKIEFSGGKADFFFFITTSNTGSNSYLKALAGLVRIIKESSAKLSESKETEDVMKIIKDSNIKLEEDVTVAEIMSKEIFFAKPEQTVSHVLNIMKLKNLKFMPVVNEKNEYLGKLDLLDILDIAYPSYLFLMHNISFLNKLRSFEEFINKENDVLVKDIYIPANKGKKRIIREDASIVELGFVFKKEHQQYLTVIDENDKVVGVVSMRDVLNKIIRA
ncbi:MAG TPA: PTS sugar transporter subunit IIA [Clostridiales bacterium]|nr:PTS sugar transporter subunit IIA [Clostridiales bacterium]